MEYRQLKKEENKRLVEIDRGEITERIYRFKDGILLLEDCYIDIKGWSEKEVNKFITVLDDIADRGGYIYGAFNGDNIVGLVALDNVFFGKNKDYLNLDKLYVSRDSRGKGVGRKLVQICVDKAKELGAKKLYVSSSELENTVNFYQGLGCILATEYIKQMWEKEPEDIHLELTI